MPKCEIPKLGFSWFLHHKAFLGWWLGAKIYNCYFDFWVSYRYHLSSDAHAERSHQFLTQTLRAVTRPYEGFRHPDWVAPESTVRGRENDSLVRPGYIHPQITSFSGGYGIFRRFTLWKNDALTQWRIEHTSFRLLILSYTPRPQPPGGKK